MNRPKADFDVLDKITKERTARGWSEYTLAKNSGISQSTISTWYRKGLQPSVASIEKICSGLDIPLSAFFGSNQRCDTLTDQQQELLELWQYLNIDQKSSILQMLRSFCPSKNIPHVTVDQAEVIDANNVTL